MIPEFASENRKISGFSGHRHMNHKVFMCGRCESCYEGRKPVGVRALKPR